MKVQTLHMVRGLGGGFVQSIEMPGGLTVDALVRRVYGAQARVSAWIRAPAASLCEWVEVPREQWRFVRPRHEVRFSYRPAGDVKEFFEDVGDFIQEEIIDPVKDIFDPPAPTVPQVKIEPPPPVTITPTVTAQPSAGIGGTRPSTASASAFSNVDSDSNVLGRDAYLPMVAGQRRISPPEIAQPFPFMDEGIQSFHRIFAFDGHHDLSSIQVDGSPVTDFPSITTQTRSGAEDAATATFVDKVSNVRFVSEELSRFILDGTDLVDQEEPADSEPRAIRFTTISHAKLEEITMRLRVSGMVVSSDASITVRVPVRIRFRAKGSSGAWTNLPEIHLIARTSAPTLQEVRLRWDNEFGVLEQGGDITYQFYQQVPAATVGTLSDGSTGVQWQAASHFVADAGALRGTQNITSDRNGVRVQLSEDVNPKIAYEWEVRRGLAENSGAFVADTYQVSGVVYPMFLGYASGTTWRVQFDQSNYLAGIVLEYGLSLVNEPPCQRPGTALLALKSRGQTVRNITVLASRYVRDWDGSGWNTLSTSSNPAVHFRQLLHDFLSHYGVDTSLINDDEFVAWRTECAARGYEVSAVFSGATMRAALEAIAVAGYARPRYSDGFGVDWFRDRSAERPVQIFSPRNSNITLNWVQEPQPTGIRATFQDSADDYRDNEVQISSPAYTSFQGYETRDYSSISKHDLVVRRATFEMLQQFYQSRRRWSVSAATEGLICERGDLVGVITDLLDDTNSGARVREVLSSTTLRLDQLIPPDPTTELFSVPNIFALDDIFIEGAQTICLVMTPSGTEQRSVVSADATDGTIRVDEPFTSTDLRGAHIALGPASRFTRRCVVADVERAGEERAALTLVDEAPEVWSEMSRRFG